MPIAAGRGGAVGNKFRMGVGMPVAGVMNCADNSGAQPSTPLRLLAALLSLFSGIQGERGERATASHASHALGSHRATRALARGRDMMITKNILSTL